MSKKDGQKSDSNDNNNNASNNAMQTPTWRYVAMANTGNGVTTEVVMQWVGGGGPDFMKYRLQILCLVML